MKRHYRQLILSAILMLGLIVGFFQISAFAQDGQSSTDHLTSVLQGVSNINQSDLGSVLGSAGVSPSGSFDIVKMIGYFLFGGIGFVAFIYGKKNSLWRPMIIGIVLNVYPYFISSTLWIYLIGMALTAALFFWRD